MPCFYPKLGYRKVKVHGKIGELYVKEPSIRPCGSCLGCRLERARQWAMRCVHESQMHEQNCFITLTYDPKFLPPDKSIHKDELQRFFKRLRKELCYTGTMPLFDKAMRIQYYRQPWHKKYGQPKRMPIYREIKYYACGEYGKRFSRPHYHACLFGYEFKDQKLLYQGHLSYWQKYFKKTNSHSLFTSKTLERIWGKGFVTIGELTFESAGYVARYCMKKITGKEASAHYKNREPEFALMSKGLGKSWYKKYFTDIYPKDFTTMNGNKLKPPRYYDYLLEIDKEDLYDQIKQKRIEKGTPDLKTGIEKAKRSPYAERYLKIITKQLQRSMENAETDDV